MRQRFGRVSSVNARYTRITPLKPGHTFCGTGSRFLLVRVKTMTDLVKRKPGRPPKITDATWAAIKAAKISGVTNKEICRDFGVSMPSLMRWLDRAINRCEIKCGQATTAADIVLALGEAAMAGKADAARMLLLRLGRGPKGRG
jgi:hypothetical protein